MSKVIKYISKMSQNVTLSESTNSPKIPPQSKHFTVITANKTQCCFVTYARGVVFNGSCAVVIQQFRQPSERDVMT